MTASLLINGRRRGGIAVLLFLQLLLLGTAQAQGNRPILRLDVLGSGTLSDQTHVYFQTGATAGFDPAYDAAKLSNPSGLNVSTFAGTQQLAISALPTLQPGVLRTVPVFIGVPAFGSYRFRVGQFDNMPYTQVYLRDVLLNVRTPLALNTQYTFSMTNANTNGTYNSSTRFVLEFTEDVLPDLVVSTPMTNPLGGYHNVTITNGGTLTLQSDLYVNGTLSVETGGWLATTSLSVGPVNTYRHYLVLGNDFTMQPGSKLSVGEAAGITNNGATGSVRTITRSFAADASYVYGAPYSAGVTAVTGNGLPATVRELGVGNQLENGTPGSYSPGTLRLSQDLTVTQQLDLYTNLDTDGQELTLHSTPTGGTAVVGAITGALSGRITVERAIDPSLNSGAGYRHFSNPLQSGNAFSFDAGPGFTAVNNPAYNTSATPNMVTPFPNLFTYDFTAIAGSPATTYSPFDRGWRALTIGAPAPARGRGFIAHLPASALVRFNGTLDETSQDVPLPANPSAQPGWVLVGNPFAAPLDARLITRPASVPAAFYVYETTGAYAGRYRSFVNGIGPSPYVPIGQGVFISQAAGAPAATLTLPVAARVPNYSATMPTLHRGADPRPQLQLSLSGNGSTDMLYVYGEAGATAAFDAQFDAQKLPSAGQVELAALAGAEALSIAGLPPFQLTQLSTVPLRVAVPRAGTYTLTADALSNLAAMPVYLLDHLTNQRIDLHRQPSYTFTASPTALAGRFTLQIGASLAKGPAAIASSISLYPNPAHTSFTVALPPVAGAVTAQAMAAGPL